MQQTVALSSLALVMFIQPVVAQDRPRDPEPVFARVEQMVTAGHDSAARAVIDSVLAATGDGTSRYAEALFWRARLSKTAAGAERDYRRIVVEYTLSPRAPESLFRLAQLEMTRNDRSSARMHFATATAGASRQRDEHTWECDARAACIQTMGMMSSAATP